MAAVQCFTDSAATSSSQESKGLQHVLLGAGTVAALRAAAQQSPTWVGGSAGQGRLKTALAALQETTHAPGILPPTSLHCDYIVDSYSYNTGMPCIASLGMLGELLLIHCS